MNIDRHAVSLISTMLNPVAMLSPPPRSPPDQHGMNASGFAIQICQAPVATAALIVYSVSFRRPISPALSRLNHWPLLATSIRVLAPPASPGVAGLVSTALPCSSTYLKV